MEVIVLGYFIGICICLMFICTTYAGHSQRQWGSMSWKWFLLDLLAVRRKHLLEC